MITITITIFIYIERCNKGATAAIMVLEATIFQAVTHVKMHLEVPSMRYMECTSPVLSIPCRKGTGDKKVYDNRNAKT